MKLKKLSKKILATALSAVTAVSMLCTGITAGAVGRYHIDTSKTATFTIHKYEMADTSMATHEATGTQDDAQYVPEDAIPLEGVTFTLYQLSGLDQYFLPDGVELPKAEDVHTESAIASFEAVTDAEGVAVFTDLPLGIYYVEETDGPAQVTKKIAPFVMSLPMTSTNGKQWLYDVYSYPKNQTAYGGVTLNKVDSSTNEALAGATFTLFSSEDGTTYTEYMKDVTTGTNGSATISSLPSNTYYKFVETAASDESYILDSTVGYEFYVDGTGDILVDGEVVENRTITVGNDTLRIHKYILDGPKGAEGIDNTANYGDTVHWKIKTSIPTNPEKLTTYTIVDSMSTGLSFKEAELMVDDTTALVLNKDYTVKQNGLSVVFNIKPSVLVNGNEVEVYFDTILETSAPLATDVPNTSKILYTNNIGTDSTYTKKSETPTVHTGGYSFIKTDGDTPLSGATFAIYATEEDAKNGTNPIQTVTSGEDGLIAFKGLEYGSFSTDLAGKAKNGVEKGSTEYWLSETDAPDGYILLSSPFKIAINNKSHLPENNTEVINTHIPSLPITGAVGTISLFLLSGVLIASGIILLSTRRKKNSVK